MKRWLFFSILVVGLSLRGFALHKQERLTFLYPSGFIDFVYKGEERSDGRTRG